MGVIITLLLLGAALIFLETLLPGMVAGIVGFLCLLAAVVLGYRDLGFHGGNIVLGVVLGGLVLGAWCWLKYFPESRMAQKFVSQSAVGDLGVARPELLHATGRTLTALRPSGVAHLNGHRVDVVAETGYLDPETQIQVIAVEGSRVVVRAI